MIKIAARYSKEPNPINPKIIAGATIKSINPDKIEYVFLSSSFIKIMNPTPRQ